MFKYKRAAGILAGAASMVAVLAAPAAALADTVTSPIGTITAGQYLGNYCDDHGADVLVTVAAGLAGATYTADTTGALSGSATFVTNSSGSGTVRLHNVNTATGGLKGIAQVTVSTGGTTVTVPATISCESQQGG